MRRILVAAASFAVAVALVGSGQASTSTHAVPHATTQAQASVSVFASGFNNPRGLTFGPDGNLYVAEGGLGGTDSTVGICPQSHGDAAPYTGSTNNPVLGGRVSRVTPGGQVSTVVNALPSSQTSPALGSLVSGVSSVAFVRGQLYALLAGAGCGHGVRTVPNGVIRVDDNGGWTMIANLSAFQAGHPVAAAEDEDFEPDGTWYSMVAANDQLYPMDSNHGELDMVQPKTGAISRVVDISAQLGHIVPTAIVHTDTPVTPRDQRRGTFLIGNLGVFGPDDAPGAEGVHAIAPNGTITSVATGFEQIVGLAIRGSSLYALELATTAGGPTPFSGALVRVGPNGPAETVASGLLFPTGMTVGPDGAFYVTDHGLGFGAGAGRVLRIVP